MRVQAVIREMKQLNALRAFKNPCMSIFQFKCDVCVYTLHKREAGISNESMNLEKGSHVYIAAECVKRSRCILGTSSGAIFQKRERESPARNQAAALNY